MSVDLPDSLLTKSDMDDSFSPNAVAGKMPMNSPPSLYSLRKGLDDRLTAPCPSCGQEPQEIPCTTCSSTTIPHVHHGMEGICQTCEGKSLISASDKDVYDLAEVRKKDLSEMHERAIFTCACDAHQYFGGAYGEGEDWGDFLGSMDDLLGPK